MACGSTKPSAPPNAWNFCNVSCATPAKGSRPDAPRGSFVTKSRPISRADSKPPRVPFSRCSFVISDCRGSCRRDLRCPHRVGLGYAGERHALAQRAKRLEEKADRLTVSAREIAARIREAGMLRPVVDEIENTTDALEDCAFLLSLVPEAETSVLAVAPLAQLSEIVTDSVGHLVRAVEAASRLPAGQRADAVASLQAIDAVVNAERSADAAERDTFAALMAAARSDARPLVLGLEIARALEKATDHLSHSALSLRDRVLEELSA